MSYGASTVAKFEKFAGASQLLVRRKFQVIIRDEGWRHGDQALLVLVARKVCVGLMYAPSPQLSIVMSGYEESWKVRLIG